MVSKEQEVIEKIEAFLQEEKFPSGQDILTIKKYLIKIVNAIDRLEIIEKQDDDDNGIQLALELIAQANIIFALREFVESDVVKKFS